MKRLIIVTLVILGFVCLAYAEPNLPYDLKKNLKGSSGTASTAGPYGGIQYNDSGTQNGTGLLKVDTSTGVTKIVTFYSSGVTHMEINASGMTIYNTSGDIVMTDTGLWGIEFDTVEAGVSVWRVNNSDIILSSTLLKGVHIQPQQATTSRNITLPSQASGSTLHVLYSDWGSGVTFRAPAGTSIYVQDGTGTASSPVRHISGNTLWCYAGNPGSKVLFLSGVSTDGTFFIDAQVSGVSWQMITNRSTVVGNTWVQ